MKCQVCGNESGKYPLCRVCNAIKEKGDIQKCCVCGRWHHLSTPCYSSGNNKYSHNSSDDFNTFTDNFNTGAYAPSYTYAYDDSFVYNVKNCLISSCEQEYYVVIQASLPKGCYVFPQVNLAAFIVKTDNSKYRNELFRNVDFLVTDSSYRPLFVIEINDQTHLKYDRRKRDANVQDICEEAGLPLVTFWTSYGVNPEYIQKKISETLASIPIERVHHFSGTRGGKIYNTKKRTINGRRSKSGVYGCRQ